MKENIIAERTYMFAIEIVKLTKELISENEYVLSKQILKSGTSIGANVEEAIGVFLKKILEQKCRFLIRKLEKLNIS